MKNAILLSNLDFIDETNEFDIIYYGAEICEELIPSIEEIKVLLSKTNKEIAILFPPLSNKGIKKSKELIKKISDLNSSQIKKIIINDIGLLNFVNKENVKYEITIGRLLTKIIGMQ